MRDTPEHKEIKLVDRFDLEQQIQECWGIVSDLEILPPSDERDALITIYTHKFNRLWDTFETVIRQGFPDELPRMPPNTLES